MNSFFKRFFCLTIACVLVTTPLQGADYSWNVTSQSWGYIDIAGNWNPSGVPGSATNDRAYFNNGRLALATSAHSFGTNALNTTLDEYSLQVGGAGGISGALQQTGGTISTTKGLGVGMGDYGYFGIAGGTLNVNSAGWNAVGGDPAIHPDNESIFIGNGGIGVYNQTGGTVNMTLSGAGYPGYAGTRFLMGGAGAADSLANFSGGSFIGPTYTGADPDMAFVMGWAGNTGVNTVNIGGTALVDLTHGGATPFGRLLIGNGGSNNILNLGDVSSTLGGAGGINGGGGTLVAGCVNNLGGFPSVVNFHGATLQASTSSFPFYGNSSFLSANRVYVYSEGAAIDTHGYNVTIPVVLQDPSLAGGSGVTGITLGADHGSGYIGEPIVTLTDSGGTGTDATARAIVDLDPASPNFGKITSLVITNPGVNYTGIVTATFTGGNPATPIDPSSVSVTTSALVSGGLRKIGTGTLTLSAVNTFTGMTTVEGGTLNLTSAGSLAGGADIFGASILTGGGSVGGNVNVRNGGTLTGSGTVSGNLVIQNGGRFTGDKTINGNTTVENGGSIDPGTATATGATIVVGGNLQLQNNSTLHFDGTSTSNYDQMAVYGSVLEDALGTPVTVKIELNLAFTPTTDLPLLTTSSLDPNNKITFTLPTGTPSLDSYNGTTTPNNLLSKTATTLSLIPSGAITDPQWNTATGNWSDASKWTSGSPAAPPVNGNQRARFDKNLGGGAITVNLNTSPTISSMIFNNPGLESYTIQPVGSNAVTLSSTTAKNWHITVLGGTHTVNANINMAAQEGGSIIRLVDGSQLTLGGIVADKAGELAGLTFNGAFDPAGGSGTLGTGKLILSGANTYSGKTVINGGILQIAFLTNGGIASPLGKSSSDPANLLINSGVLRYTGTAGGSTDRGITVGGNGAIRVDNDATITGQIVGNIGSTLNVTGARKLTLAYAGTSIPNSMSVGANSAGKLAITAGTVALNDTVDQGNLALGDNATGVLSVGNGAQLNVRSFTLGKNGGSGAGVGGAIVQTGGTVNIWGDGNNPAADSTLQTYNGVNFGHNAYGYYQMAGGELNLNVYARSGYNPVYMGLNAPAVFDQTGGIVNTPAASNMLLGVYETAVMNITGGEFRTSNLSPIAGILVGNSHGGILNIGGGTTRAIVDTTAGPVAGMICLARLPEWGPASGTVNLATNGTLKVGGVYGAGVIESGSQGMAEFNFHGGTLTVGTTVLAGPTFMEGLSHAYLYAEGGTIDTNGQNTTIAQSIEDPTGSGIGKIDVVSGGSGYIGAPLVTVTSLSGMGSGATAVAVMNGDKVDHLVITNPGSGYAPDDTLSVALSGGGFTTPANVSIGTGTTYFTTNTGGQLQKVGAGTLTLSGWNTYTGLTSVKEGGLDVAGAVAGNVDMYAGTVLSGSGTIYGSISVQTGATVAPGNITVLYAYGNLTLQNNAKLSFNSDGSYASNVSGIVSKPTISGTAIVDFVPSVEAVYPVTLNTLSWASADTLTAGSLIPSRDSVGRSTFRLDLATPGQVNVIYSPVANEWQGPSGGDYFAGSNWTTYVPGASGSTDLEKQAVFGTLSGGGTVNVNNALSLGSLIFDNAAADYNLSGAAITLNSTTTVAAQIAVLNSPIVGHTVANALTLNSHTDIRVTGGITFSGSIVGMHAPALYGDNLVFSGHNTYSGTTINQMVNFLVNSPTGHAIPGDLTMSGVWLMMGAADQFGASSVVTMKSGEWTLNGYNQTVAGISSEENIGVIENSHVTQSGVAVGSSVLTVNTATACTFSGIIRDHGGDTAPGFTFGLTKTGSAALTLSGALTYSGPTTLEEGLLKIEATNTLAGDLLRGVSTSGTLEVGGVATTLTATGDVDLGAAIIGDGNTLIIASNVFSAPNIIDHITGNGTLQIIGSDTTLSSNSIHVDTLIIGSVGSNMNAVPEPSTLLLLAIAGTFVVWLQLRKE